jgi:glycolate oxidase FAD binding subunit
MDELQALQQLQHWGARPLPISASCWRDGSLWLRLSGSEAAVLQAAQTLGGERLGAAEAIDFWRDLREQCGSWFEGEGALWRVSLPAAAGPLALAGEQCMEWGGALRWLRTPLPAATVRERARALGGHATHFRGGDRARVFTPLAAPIAAIHQRLKDEFDPARIFNPGRMYEGL